MTNFGRQLRGELFRMSARRRTYIGFACFLGIELLVLFFLQTDGMRRFYTRVLERNGFAFEEYFSALTLAFIVLAMTVFILGALFLALVSGDIVAKEVEEGTLRMVLSRPVTRLRLLACKYIACVVYTICLIFFLGVTALIMGIVDRGWGGGFFAFAPEQGVFAVYDFWPGLRRYFVAVLFLALSMQTVSSVGFCFSCQRMKPAAATILTVSLFFIDMVLGKWPALEEYWGYFLTPKMDDWALVLRDVVPWAVITKDYALLLGANLTCFLIGWISFEARDLKS